MYVVVGSKETNLVTRQDYPGGTALDNLLGHHTCASAGVSECF